MSESTPYRQRIREAADALRERLPETPRIALVLGSGLGEVADAVDRATPIPYEEIPHWPRSSVVGHAGRLVLGELSGIPAAVCQGRVHLYEGFAARDVAFPVRVLRELGVEVLVVTNAAGCLREEWAVPGLMLLSDHINLTGKNPLTGPHEPELGPRFPDMSRAYDPTLRGELRSRAERLGIRLEEGVYVAVPGPCYETPAEVRMLARLGADAVGMSTVPEVVAAVHGGMRVAGISSLTNPAAGLAHGPLDHEEVLEAGRTAARDLCRLLVDSIPALAASLAAL